MPRDALGLVETYGLIASIVATDAAAKAAAVVITTAELTEAAFLTIKIEGELGAVQAAVEAAAEAAAKVGQVVSVHVIPRPDDGLEVILPNLRYITKYHPDEKRPALRKQDQSGNPEFAPRSNDRPATPRAKPKTVDLSQIDAEMLENMTVTELRRLGRGIDNLALKGREISRANKQQLIDAIKQALGIG
jgi:ethanolamine utilization protein EutM